MKVSNKNNMPMDVCEELLREMGQDDRSCGIYVNDTMIFHKARGVKPMVDFWSCGNLKEAIVCDKVVGKASAMLLVNGGAKFVYGKIMSKLALDFLNSNNLECAYEQLVEKIQNREGNGLCPMESLVIEIEDTDQGIEKIIDKMEELGIK